MASSKDTLTEKDMHNLALTWQCFIGGEPAIDYAKFARLAGYTEGSARTTLGSLKRKIKALGQNGGGASTASPEKKRARKKNDGDDEDGGTPAKKQRGGRKAKVEKLTEQQQQQAVGSDSEVGLMALAATAPAAAEKKARHGGGGRKAKGEKAANETIDEAGVGGFENEEIVTLKQEEDFGQGDPFFNADETYL